MVDAKKDEHKDDKKATSESKEGFPKAKADEVYTGGAKPPEQPPEPPPAEEAPPPEPSAKTKEEMAAGKKAVEGK